MAQITLRSRWNKSGAPGACACWSIPALREKFDKQRFKFNAAIWHGDLAELQREAQRMINAWMALDRAAEAAGASELDPLIWETTMSDGTVLALIRTFHDLKGIIQEGRQVVSYTLEESGRDPGTLPGDHRSQGNPSWRHGEVIRRDIGDPLDGIRDGRRLEDTLDDALPTFGQGG